MKSINLKKLFCVMLSASIIMPSGVNAKSASSKWNSENVKKVVKKAAPYVAGIGAPVAAIVVVGSVLLAKNFDKSNKDKNNSDVAKSKSDDTDNKNDSSSGNQIPASVNKCDKSPSNISGEITQEFVDSCIEKGTLPGIEFHTIKSKMPGFRKYLFYKITDNVAAHKYLEFVKSGNKRNVFEWQMCVIYQDKVAWGAATVSAVFGKDTALARDINRVVSKIIDDENFECKDYTIQKDKSAEGWEREKVIIAGEKDSLPAPTDADMPSDPMPGKVDVKKQQPKTQDKDESVSTEDSHSERQSTQTPSEQLLSDIVGSDAVAGSSVSDEAAKKVKKNVNDAMSKGELPGFQFYRCKKSIRGTYHCYIVVDATKAKQSLGIKDENDETWRKVLCYQNRWLFKDSTFSKWSFGRIFGLEKGFGKKFDIITHENDIQSREGTITFEKGTSEYETANIGCAVFQREDKRMKNIPYVSDDALISVITKENFDNPEDVLSAYK
ncbi:MAG: hypothetical protein Q4D57_04865 [Clostridia bacterium]|nr:hypothetical protein [Clostridia bacterium]